MMSKLEKSKLLNIIHNHENAVFYKASIDEVANIQTFPRYKAAAMLEINFASLPSVVMVFFTFNWRNIMDISEQRSSNVTKKLHVLARLERIVLIVNLGMLYLPY